MGMARIGIGHYVSHCGKVFGTVQLAIERFCAVGALPVLGVWRDSGMPKARGRRGGLIMKPIMQLEKRERI
jgi:hypothetical protein